MKGIVAEIHSSHMIVIAKNGDFIKCKKLPNCNIGEEINIPAKSISSIYKKISTIAASFIILAMLSTGVYAYYTPYSYVSVDINPSMELYVNRFDRVIGVHAFNEDAQKLLATSASIKNKGIDAALEQILDSAADKGYLKENEENSVMIVVSSNSKKEETAISDKISKTSTAALAKVSGDYEVILEKTEVSNYNKAKEGNISPGKVILANKFKEVKPEIDEEEIKHMPLRKAIEQIEKKEEKTVKKPEESKSAVGKNKPKTKDEKKGNVMNVKELIQEKNEELGEKLDRDKKEKEDKEEKDKESFKQNKENDNKKKNEKENSEDIKNQDPSNEKKTDEIAGPQENMKGKNNKEDEDIQRDEKPEKDDKKKD